jgi:hypothetical protein
MMLAAANRGQREETIRARRLEHERERNHLRAACDALQQEIGALESRCERLRRELAQAGGRPLLDDLRRELARLETEINQALSATTLTRVASTTAAHRRPWKASDVLAQLTDGRLLQIRTSAQGPGATVVDREGRALSIAELNTAESDQLYLALTLALASSFASRGVDLPLLLDEPFLRQDARAAAAMAGVLAEYARMGRQVVVFTEDREAARRFEALGISLTDIEEQRRSPVAVQTPAASPKIRVPSPPTTLAPATVRLVRETLNEPKPQLRVASEWHDGDDERQVYYLTLGASIGDFPVLGNDTAKIFAAIGIHTVEDLILADPASVASRLRRTRVSSGTVRLWQSHMTLMCFVPGLSLNDAQVLAANDVRSPESLLAADVRRLAEAIGRFLASGRGRRFAAARGCYTEERLAELQNLAAKQQERWLKIRDRMAGADRPAAGASHREPRLSTAGRAKAKPVAGTAQARSKRRPLAFTLGRQSPVNEAPSVGPHGAELMAKVGIRTIADLLNANPQSVADEIAEPSLTAEVITRWQVEARLACRIPGLRRREARLLAACGYAEAEQVAGADVAELAKKVQTLCATSRGKRLLGANAKTPARGQVAQWVRQAAKMRPLEAA